MIFEIIVIVLTAPIEFLLSLLPDIDVSLLDNWAYIKDMAIDIFSGIGCLIPLSGFIPLVVFQASLGVFRLMWAVILRIKSFIPFIGGG